MAHSYTVVISVASYLNKEQEIRMLMEVKWAAAFFLLLVLQLNSTATAFGDKNYTRHDFPQDFIFGSSTSAYQLDGAANEDGRTPSIFDTFVHDENWNWGNGDVACDGYHKYKEDVQLMVDTGLDAYRFSISWPRLIPHGRGPVNPKGLAYYNNLINELINNGIQPHVTLMHLEVPQELEDEYGSFVSGKFIQDFTAFANVCFREFGDRVLHWTTINEANVFIMAGYDTGQLPPGRCSPPFGRRPGGCRRGNSTAEPYVASHIALLAHASVVRLYRNIYQAKQHGFIGLNLFAYNFVPATNKPEDLLAVKRANDFYHGWFMEPLLHGDYPGIMKENVGKRLPAFTEDEANLVKGSFDFIGINHYATVHTTNNPDSLVMEQRDLFADIAVTLISDFPASPPGLFPVTPWGLQSVLEYFKDAYSNPPIYIHENGQMTYRNNILEDTSRVEYLQSYVGSVLDAVRNGSNTKGYFIWSFLDVFELLDGYRSSFGLYYVDMDDPNRTRYPKSSQRWYSGFLKGGGNAENELIQLHSSSSM